MNKTYQHMDGLDLLRGLAALWVLLFHFVELAPPALTAGLDSYFLRVGWCGVDLFFVLSGFLIGRIITGSPTPGVRSFMVRRVLRIYPAFFVVLLLSLVLMKSEFLLPPHLPLLVSHVFMLHNLIPGYGGAINGVFWTLGAEFQFYVLAAVLLLFIKHRQAFAWVVGAMLITALLYRFGVYQLVPDLGSNRFFFATQLPGMLDLFAMGFVAASLRTSLQGLITRYFYLLAPLSLLAVGAFLLWLRPHTGDYWVNPMAMVFGRTYSGLAFATLVLVFSCMPQGAGQLCRRTGLVFLGNISYGLYLTHLLLLNLTLGLLPADLTAVSGVGLFLLYLGSVLLASSLLFYIVEKPAIAYAKRLTSRSRPHQERAALSTPTA